MQEITKIIALSDTHNGKIPSIVSAYLKDADYLLHVGDIASLSAYNDLIELALLTKNKSKGLIVAKGSEDNDSSLPALKDKNVITVSGVYVFRWNNIKGPNVIPETDEARLIEFLQKNLGIDWVKTAKIKKDNIKKTIKVYTSTNSLFLILNEENQEVILKMDGSKIDKFIVKKENGELNIFGGISIGLMHDVLTDGSPYFTSATDLANGSSGEWVEWGLANGVNVLVFGHVRYPIIANGKNLLICPGHSSSSYTADDCGSVPTMAQLIIKEGFVFAAIVPLDGSLRNNEHFAKFWPYQSD
ncbi:MAG: metallophosphoesterase family protein [Methanothrix sp.]|nr:metallophosphoesterase family protein [Methanothrix sp.]